MELGNFFWGVAFGFLCCLLLIVMALRHAWRNKEILTSLIREIYHVDLLPFVCRIEGLLNLASMESPLNTAFAQMYVELALGEIRELKEKIIKALKRYEHYQ